MSQLLSDKVAVIYGAGGSIGGAAETAAIDALDEGAVNAVADTLGPGERDPHAFGSG